MKRTLIALAALPLAFGITAVPTQAQAAPAPAQDATHAHPNLHDTTWGCPTC